MSGPNRGSEWQRSFAERSLSRFEQRRCSGAELFEQHRLLGLSGGEVTLFDVTETADFFRDRGECDGEAVVLRREIAGNFAKERAVILKEPALGTALGGVAEQVERGAAQEF